MRGGTVSGTIGRGRHRKARIPALVLSTALFAATVVALAAPVGAEPAPDLSLAKSANVSAYPHVGTVITYTYDVTNTGTSTLTNITVTDPMAGLSSIDCGGGTNVIASLAPGASKVCTATYTTTQAVQDNGYLTNTGSATVSTPAGTETATSTIRLPSVKGPAVSIEKTADVSGFSTAGTTITYSYIVTNTGYETLYSVTVTDPMPGLSAINCPTSTLAPGASETCTATYVTTAADVEAGSISNAGTVNVVNEDGTGARATAGLEISAAGEPITCDWPGFYLSQGVPTQLYTGIEVNNTVSQNALGSTHRHYNALGYDTGGHYLYAMDSHTNTLIRIDGSGSYTTIGTVTGVPVPTDSFNVGAFDQLGNYWITESNDSVAYKINVNNPSGTAQTLSKPFAPADWSYTAGYLWGISGTTMYRVGPSGTVRGGMTVPGLPPVSGNNPGTYGAAWTFGNGNLGFSNNRTGQIFEVSVTNPSATFPASPVFNIVATYSQTPAPDNNNDGAACMGKPADIGIVKTAPSAVAAGNTITWTVTVTNHGPGNSSGFVVNDVVPAGVTNVHAVTAGCHVTGNTVQCDEGALANGASFVITLTGTAPNVVPTCVTNTASVIGNEMDPNSANDSSTATTCTAKVIHITKTADIRGYAKSGVVVTYTYAITNESVDSALVDLTLSDPMKGLSGPDCGNGSAAISELDAGATRTCTATYTTTAGDVSAGSISNTAVVRGVMANGGAVLHSNKSTVAIPVFGITTTSLPDATIGVPYHATLEGTGGTLPYKWAQKGLPAGLKLDPSSGVISGTVTKGSPATDQVFVTLFDASKPKLTATAQFALTIDRPPAAPAARRAVR